MAKKKKKSSRKKQQAPTAPQHSLPPGFWAQVGAVMLVLFSLLLIVSWFGAGGPVLEWIHTATLQVMGYAGYVLPFLLVYVAVEIFRSDENKLPLVMKFAVVLEIIWLSGLFGLLKSEGRPYAGGFV